ncbi:hypothetical protein ACFVDI_27360 [Nocardioides sp. NPDC057767]|uniref:hypothetical protein n=1 Tax=Nocardioides sp. NPDC057767 TaxID=3346244 RepID=UPI00366B2E06
MSAAPASAATVSQASATALSLELAGTGARDTGTYAVTNNGSTESAKGTNEPLITALGGQKAIHAGTLAQDAVATKDATSAACSGLAGDGATVVAVGSGDCLSGGDNISLDAASLDFADVELVSSGLFQGVDRQLITELEKVGLSQTKVTDPLSKALKDLLAAMGDPGLHLDLGAVQSSCTADKDKASGDSSLANSRAYITVPTVGDVTLVDLPVDPDVNQKVVTDLTGVTDAILDALRTQFTKALNGALAPANGGLDQLQTQVLDTALGQIQSQLAPLEENVLDITLNAQSTSPGAITVTALDVKVLPAAQEFVGGSLAHLTIGTSSCGPNSPISKTVKNPPKADNPPASVPTVVTAGVESYDDGSAGRIALVTLLLLAAAGAGVATYVRMLRRG